MGPPDAEVCSRKRGFKEDSGKGTHCSECLLDKRLALGFGQAVLSSCCWREPWLLLPEGCLSPKVPCQAQFRVLTL